MPMHHPKLSSSASVGLVGLLLCALAQVGQGSQVARRESAPVFVWGVYRDCAWDAAATDAVSLRLRQMAESVIAVKHDRPVYCVGSECLAQFAASHAAARSGQLLGGSLRTQANGETSVRLWRVDLASQETQTIDGSCLRCDVVELVTRRTADLLEQAPGPGAERGATGFEPARVAGALGGASADEVGARPPNQIHIYSSAASGGGKQKVQIALDAAQKTARQMGYQVISGTSEIAKKGKKSHSLTYLDITLIKDRISGGSSVRFQYVDPNGERTTVHADCGASECRAGRLSQLTQLNVGVLLDAVAPLKTYPLTSILAEARTRANWQDPTACRPKLVTLGDPPPGSLPGSGVTGTGTDAAAVGEQASKPPKEAATPEAQTAVRRSQYSPFWNVRRVLGLAAVVGSVVGYSVSAWYVSQNHKPSDVKDCSLGLLPSQPCNLNTTNIFAGGFAASSGGLALGIILIAIPNR